MLIAGLDFGTSGVKLVAVDGAGAIVARAQADYGTTTGPAGESEQRPEDWWAAARAVVAESGCAGRIDALGLTGQMQDLIPVAAARSLRPALLYSDTRAGEQHARLRAQLPDWEAATGNQQDVTNVAAKIAWLAEHEPGTLENAEHLLFGAPGYIAWRATGLAACDVTTASTTGLLDTAERRWSGDVVTAAGARTEQLPALVDAAADAATPEAPIGELRPAAAAELGLRTGIPVVLAMGDAGATTDGLVGSAPGDAYLYLGTTGWLAGVTPAPRDGGGEPSPIHSLVLPGWQTRLRIGAVQSAGSTADWARRAFLPGLGFAEVEARVAERVADPAAVAVRPLCLPGLSGERTPVRDGDFRGAFVGVHERTGPMDFYLGALTGVAMGLRHAADAMGIDQSRIPLVGGAAASPAWRRILADVFDATIVTGAAGADDPAAHSAVRAAAGALGVARPAPLFAFGRQALGRNASKAAATTETEPGPARRLYAETLATHRALYDALAPAFHRKARQ